MAKNTEHPTPSESIANPGALELDRSEDEISKLEDRRKQRLSEKAAITGRIGETCRYIGFGVLAIFYTIITSDKPFAMAIASNHRFYLYLSGLAASIAVFSDYLQYLSGAWSVEKTLKRRENQYYYNTGWISYKLRVMFYWIKQVAALIASATVVYIVIVQFVIGV